MTWTYQLPFMRDKKAGMAKLIGGWSFSGVFRYDQGRPIGTRMANDLGGILFNSQKRPDRMAGATGVAGGDFDPNVDRYFNASAWADPGRLNFGNAPVNDGTVRGFANITEDLSIFKDIWLNERFKMRFESNFGNIFNRTVYCAPNSNFSSSGFGQVFQQCNIPRSIQFGLRVDF